ncbi:MAG: hypothetical protein CMN58_02665 [Solibacterales bacterium]|nr:hypothetical protein [Bryobacterales bacterium]|tara:strand:- start:6275 stop:7297 length:1023 start_codon:yes stop_codon:yes gene_type:complete
MTVSIVIPNLNRQELLMRLLATIKKQYCPQKFKLETIVVDNGSTDSSVEVAREWGAHVIPLGANVGVSKAFNLGIKASHGEFIAVVNNDIELADDWLTTLMSKLEDNNIWFATGKTLACADRNLIDGVGDAMCCGGTTWRLGHGKSDGPWFEIERKIYFPSATATIFRRAFFERVGLFEERFFAYLEDVDLGLRALIEKLPGVYVPLAKAYHHGSATTGTWSHQMIEWMTCNQILLLAKFYSLSMLMHFARAITTAQVLWAVMAISRGRGIAWFRGLMRGIGLFGSMRASSTTLRSDGNGVSSALVATENQIAQVQQVTNWDTYWKWYFRFRGTTPECLP